MLLLMHVLQQDHSHCTGKILAGKVAVNIYSRKQKSIKENEESKGPANVNISFVVTEEKQDSNLDINYISLIAVQNR